jgi:hypothetical protein
VVTARRDKATSLKLLKRILKKYGASLGVVTDSTARDRSRRALQRLTEDGETVIPSLPEPGVWTGRASPNASGAVEGEAREHPLQ